MGPAASAMTRTRTGKDVICRSLLVKACGCSMLTASWAAATPATLPTCIRNGMAGNRRTDMSNPVQRVRSVVLACLLLIAAPASFAGPGENDCLGRLPRGLHGRVARVRARCGPDGHHRFRRVPGKRSRIPSARNLARGVPADVVIMAKEVTRGPGESGPPRSGKRCGFGHGRPLVLRCAQARPRLDISTVDLVQARAAASEDRRVRRQHRRYLSPHETLPHPASPIRSVASSRAVELAAVAAGGAHLDRAAQRADQREGHRGGRQRSRRI